MVIHIYIYGVCIYVEMVACIYEFMYVYIHTYIRIYMCTRTYIYTRTHTCILFPFLRDAVDGWWCVWSRWRDWVLEGYSRGTQGVLEGYSRGTRQCLRLGGVCGRRLRRPPAQRRVSRRRRRRRHGPFAPAPLHGAHGGGERYEWQTRSCVHIGCVC